MISTSRKKKLTTSELNQHINFLSYLAGYIDADGCITVRKRNQDSGRVYHTETVRIGSVKLPILKYLQKYAGGKIYDRGNSFILCWEGEQGRNICLILIPYLIQKKQQAIEVSKYPKMVKGIYNKKIEKLKDKSAKRIWHLNKPVHSKK